jgi:hypothetical protein
MVVVLIWQHRLKCMITAMVTFRPIIKLFTALPDFQAGGGNALRRWLVDFHRTIPLRQTNQIK